ncbi:DUF1294 domain-containing protein [Clostridium rectalis]|uniref:DUF1294 domain-containing protein n=1 Tax=Clostridium rectalis TaxID=2040295 RepID=UPI000F62C441|nr:DUF1294 domain-containing protein [Clostridium rectalis]
MKLLLYYLISINLLGILIMYIDKKKAIKHEYRISEKSLFSVALFLGSFGMLLGMYIFRHKTKHLKFKLGIPIIFILQIILLNYLNKHIL